MVRSLPDFVIRERVPDCGAGNRKSPTAVSVEPVTRYCKQLMVGGTQMPESVITGDWDVHKMMKNVKLDYKLQKLWQMSERGLVTGGPQNSACRSQFW